MPKPPPSTPHSDMNGVHVDEKRSTEIAARQGDSAGALKKAQDENKARPPYEEDEENADDRTG